MSKFFQEKKNYLFIENNELQKNIYKTDQKCSKQTASDHKY